MSERYFSSRLDLTHVTSLDRKGYPPSHPNYLKECLFKIKTSGKDSGTILHGWLSRDGKRFMESGIGIKLSEVREFLDNPDLGIPIHSAMEVSEKQWNEMART